VFILIIKFRKLLYTVNYIYKVVLLKMNNLMRILFFIIILSLIFPFFNVTSNNNLNKKIEQIPIGSPGPIIAKFLEFYAIYSGQYYTQERWLRDFEIQRQIINGGTNQVDLIIVDDEGDGNFTKIQSAINYSKTGDAILVYSGYYSENILINKSIWLIGINSEYKSGDDFGEPIISNLNEYNFTQSIIIDADNVTFSGFKIISNGIGIEVLNFSDSVFLCYNKIFMGKNSSGMILSCNNSFIKHNSIFSNKSNLAGIILNNTISTQFYNNIVNNFSYGITISDSINNHFNLNFIINNLIYGVYLKNGVISNNIFTFNNFKNNSINAYINLDNNKINNNSWYFQSLGNHWDDHIVNDTNNDGIGDEPYIISNGKIIDNYPIVKYFDNNPPNKPIINKDEIGVLCLKTNELIPIFIYFSDPDNHNLSYKIYFGNNFSYSLDQINSESILEINNIWKSEGKNLVTVYYIQIITFDEYLYPNISDLYEIHVYDLSNIKNILVRNLLDNLIPSYFLTNWN